MRAQVEPSGECIQGYKPGVVVTSRFLANSVVTWPACRYLLCCLAWQLVRMYVLSYVTNVRLSSWIDKGD